MGQFIRKMLTWRMVRRPRPNRERPMDPKRWEMSRWAVMDAHVAFEQWMRRNGIK